MSERETVTLYKCKITGEYEKCHDPVLCEKMDESYCLPATFILLPVGWIPVDGEKLRQALVATTDECECSEGACPSDAIYMKCLKTTMIGRSCIKCWLAYLTASDGEGEG